MVAMTDEEQKTQMKSFMQSYGIPIIIGIVLGVGGFLGWNWHQDRQFSGHSKITEQYLTQSELVSTAVQDEKAYQKMQTDVDAMAKANPNTAAVLYAQLMLGGVALERKDFAKAEQYFNQAKTSSVPDEGLRTVATLQLVYTYMEQKQWDKALQILDSIKQTEFMATANEIRGDIFVAQNKLEDAKKAYQQAWEQLMNEQEVRELLQVKLANLGVSVEIPDNMLPIQRSAVEQETAVNEFASSPAIQNVGEPAQENPASVAK